MGFEFACSDRIIFGNGALSGAKDFVKDFGEKAYVIAGGGSVPIDPLMNALEQANVRGEVFRVEQEPNVETIEAGLNKAKSFSSDFVIGFGGGSVLDSAKAIAALLTNPGELSDYLEVIGGGKKIPNPSAPMIAIPTTAGTGTEVTRNAVISSPEHNVKVSMRSPKMIPTVALIDPELTYSMPPSVTASTGMDALTQVIEAYVSKKANPMTDIIAADGIKRGASSLLRAYKDGQDPDAREDMALTSLFGGLALANGGLGAVHGFAGPIGGMFNAPHGVICASLLPHVMLHNARIIQEMPDNESLIARFQQVAAWVTGDSNASIDEGVNWLNELASALQVPRLSEMGIRQDDFDRIIEKSKAASSMQKNPVPLEDETLRKILSEAY